MPVRVSQANSRVLIGRIVEYWSRGEMKTSRILGVSASGKTLVIDNLDLQNGLQVVSRIVHLTTVRVTQANSKDLIGRMVKYWSRGEMKTSRILGVSPSGKTLTIDNPDLQNGLEVVSRNVQLID